MRRFAVTKERLITYLHRHTCSQHRVHHDQRLALHRRSGHILGDNLQFALGIEAAVGTEESVLRVVEDIEESLMQRQTGTQDSSQHELVGNGVDRCDAQRRLHVGLLVVERLAHFDCHEFADSLDVATETEAILLDVDIADFAQVHVEHAVVLGEVDDLHIGSW